MILPFWQIQSSLNHIKAHLDQSIYVSMQEIIICTNKNAITSLMMHVHSTIFFLYLTVPSIYFLFSSLQSNNAVDISVCVCRSRFITKSWWRKSCTLHNSFSNWDVQINTGICMHKQYWVQQESQKFQLQDFVCVCVYILMQKCVCAHAHVHVMGVRCLEVLKLIISIFKKNPQLQRRHNIGIK